MVAKGGTRLINQSAIKNLKKMFLNNVYLITPNIPEAEVLTKKKIKYGKSLLFGSSKNILFVSTGVMTQECIKVQKLLKKFDLINGFPLMFWVDIAFGVHLRYKKA